MIEQFVVFIASCFLVAGFIVLLFALKLIQNAHTVIQLSRSSLETMGDPLLSDDIKEKKMQQNALSLFKLFALLTIGGFFALAIPAGAVWMMDRAGWLSFNAVVTMTLDWRFLLGSTIVGIAVFKLRNRRSKKQESDFENRYSGIDRLLHATAFAMMPVQRSLASLEDKLYAKALSHSAGRPVYITGLPRSGTTLLLELLYRLPEFSTHTYRNMPFLMTPLFWNRFASHFRREGEARERAHGDGMNVGLNSPEAFEEVIWMHFWPKHYRGGSITPWDATSDDSFERFYRMHQAKIALLKDGETENVGQGRRYISKNNLNISRIRLLLENDGDARVILPFRDPYQHAASLLLQHRNFLDIHEKDDFARRYMADIGHFDFGRNLKPINFDNWLQHNEYKDPRQLSFWLSYWAATYSHQLAHYDERVMFSDFDQLCVNPVPALSKIADFLGIGDRDGLLSQSSRIQPQRTHEIDINSVDDELKNQVESVLSKLKSIAMH